MLDQVGTLEKRQDVFRVHTFLEYPLHEAHYPTDIWGASMGSYFGLFEALGNVFGACWTRWAP